MTTDPDFDRYAREWLEDGPVQLADPVLDATLVAVHRTTQQHRQSFGRFSVSFTSPRLIAAAVIVLLVAGGAVGLAVLRSPAQVIGQPSPAVSGPAPSGAAVASPRASSAPAVFADPNTYIFAMDPGYASPGTDAPPSWLEVAGPTHPNGHQLAIAVDGDLRDPAWSPDGSQIAFVSATPSGASVWTAASDGSSPTKMATCASPCSSIDRPSWSPDGKQLVMTELDIPAGKAQPTAARIVVLTLAGGARSVIAEGGPDALPVDAGWSPRGDALVYDRVQLDTTGKPTAASVWTIGADGTGETQVTGLPPTGGEPAWSPAGVIAFGDGINIFTVPVAGGTPTQVTNLSATSQQANRSPGWTPDGRISYVHEPTNGTNVLLSVAADGSDPAVIFSGGGRVYPDKPAARPE